MVASVPLEPARLPPNGLPGLDLALSRLETVEIDGTERTFHFLDSDAADSSTADSQPVELTLLCVHGNPSWSYLWRDLFANLPSGVRAIAVDHLDMGFSERTGTFRRLAQRIDDLTALTDHLKLTGPVVTVAHDWGGPISLGWALRHLGQLKGVVLTNTAVHQPEGSPAPKVIRAARTPAALQRTTVDTTAFITGAFEMSKPRTPAHIRQGFLAPYQSKERRVAIGQFVEDIPLEDGHPSADTLTAIAEGLEHLESIPALLLWGAKDPVFSDLYLHDLEERLPHADVHRWPNASHFVTEDADVTSALMDWVGDLNAEAAAPSTSDSPSTLLDQLQNESAAVRLAIAEMTGDKAAVTFGDLSERVEQTAAALATHGVDPGDRVAVLVPPGIDLAGIVYGCWRLGAVAVLVDGALSPPQMTAALKSANPKYLVGISKALAASRALRWPGEKIALAPLSKAQSRTFGVVADLETLVEQSSVDENRPLPRESDEAIVVFTSGSTGPSKGVRYTHGQLAAQRELISELYSITSADSLVAAFAPFALYGPMLGITSVVPDMDVSAPASITAQTLADAVAAIDATMVFASPAALASTIRTRSEIGPKHRDALAAVRLVLSAGAPIRTTLFEQTLNIFPNAEAYTPYGMTEMLPVSTINLDQIREAGPGDGVCVGKPAPGVEVQIDPIEPGALFGEIVARAPHMRHGYDRLWHTTFRASQPDGWHCTGDLGFVDDAGRLWMGGRVADVLFAQSGPVTPVRYEQSVEDLPGVSMAALVGVGPKNLEQGVMIVELDNPPKKAGLAELSVIDNVRSAVASASGDTPQNGLEIVAVLSVPKMPVDRRHNSKIDRQRLRVWAGQLLAGGKMESI